MALRKTEKIGSLWTGRGQARLARAGEGSVHAVANWTWCPELEVGRKSDRALAGPISAYRHPERSEQRERSRRISDSPLRSLARLLAGIGQPALSEDPSPACGRGQAARRLPCFCNRRDARVRVQRALASWVGSIFS